MNDEVIAVKGKHLKEIKLSLINQTVRVLKLAVEKESEVTVNASLYVNDVEFLLGEIK